MPDQPAIPSSETAAALPAFDPAAPLCHCQALRQAARRATAFYDAAMAPFGLRISQYAMLHRLGRLGPLGVQALAAALLLDRTTLGRNLRPLERDGLIESAADATDGRVRRVGLTAKGRAVLKAAAPAWTEVQARFEREFGADRATDLRHTLHALSATLQDGPDTP